MAHRIWLVLGLSALLSQLIAPVLAQPAGQSAPGGSAQPGGAAGTAAEGEEPGISGREKQLLERIRRMKAPRWRTFGACRYDWGAWRLSEGGVRLTEVECGTPPVRGTVAVHCETLRVTRRGDDGSWKAWRLPLAAEESTAMGGEDVMVATLCANLAPAPAAAPPTRPPTTPPSPGGESGGAGSRNP